METTSNVLLLSEQGGKREGKDKCKGLIQHLEDNTWDREVVNSLKWRVKHVRNRRIEMMSEEVSWRKASQTK